MATFDDGIAATQAPENNDDDITTAVEPEPVLEIQPAESGNVVQTDYDYVLDPDRG